MPAPWDNWISRVRRWGRRCLRWGRPDPRPTGPAGVALLGHRKYVGGRWDEIGQLQFAFLVAAGLRPEHLLLDVACGSLRAGVHLIPYLNPGHYWGLEKEAELIEAGLKHELDPLVRQTRRPHFLINADFHLAGLISPVDYLWIHSLFTHLPLTEIERCLKNVRLVARDTAVCYATYFETAIAKKNRTQSHDHDTFVYTRDELRHCTATAGWQAEFIGDWGHPRGQQMLKLTMAKPTPK